MSSPALNRSLAIVTALCLSACGLIKPACAPADRWISPATMRVLPDPIPQAALHSVVLIGEQHDRAPDHRWQLATIERIHALRPSIVLGFEMFPRADQKVLDRWVAGELSETQFLDQTDWKHVWGMAPELYLPIFRFARQHHVPMLALNVSRQLVHKVGQVGWDAVKPAERESVGNPAPPTQAYRAALEEAMSGHGAPSMPKIRLDHFIQAQQVWDRAMAEAIAAQRPRQVVAIMGTGHLQNRDGVPHQLDAIGIHDSVVLIPQSAVCAAPDAGFADAIWTEAN